MATFYGGGGYNYSHECMELLHNLRHDWPNDAAQVLLASMLVNTTGEADGFVEGDMDVEHLNKIIKSRVHGQGASPELLAKFTPSICHVQKLSRQLFSELHVDEINQRHHHVSQTGDIRMLTAYLTQTGVFDFTEDQKSEHIVVDLVICLGKVSDIEPQVCEI